MMSEVSQTQKVMTW